MSMAWIRKNYRVPAKRGARVRYMGGGKPELGAITSARGSQLMILLDGARHALPFHPTWELTYLADAK